MGRIFVVHGSTTSDFKAKRTIRTVPVYWVKIERMKVTEHNNKDKGQGAFYPLLNFLRKSEQQLPISME